MQGIAEKKKRKKKKKGKEGKRKYESAMDNSCSYVLSPTKFYHALTSLGTRYRDEMKQEGKKRGKKKKSRE
jgi:hypothetical protein